MTARAVAESLAAATVAAQAAADDDAAFGATGRAYQTAVKRNDAAAMAAILHNGIILVLSDSRFVGRAARLDDARSGRSAFDAWDKDPNTQTMQVYRTAVVFARLRSKDQEAGTPFDRTLGFSDSRVQVPGGRRYAFGQASLPLSGRH